jgi:hypothetical protein
LSLARSRTIMLRMKSPGALSAAADTVSFPRVGERGV